MKWYNLLGFDIVYIIEVLGHPEAYLYEFKYDVKILEKHYKWLCFTIYKVKAIK